MNYITALVMMSNQFKPLKDVRLLFLIYTWCFAVGRIYEYILPNKYPPSTKTQRNSEVITAAQHKVPCLVLGGTQKYIFVLENVFLSIYIYIYLYMCL